MGTAGVMVTVGDPGNAADVSGFGAVNYTFNISATEVTNSEYAAFLNAVAATDPNFLYETGMAGATGGITRTGGPGSYSYSVAPGRGDHPVAYVSFYNSLRYANWLNNGSPVGSQGISTTEDGAYTITAAGIAANSIVRNLDAQFFLPSEDEWYKAAFYDPSTSSYFRYATSSNIDPTAEFPVGGSNSGNFNYVVKDTTPVGAYSAALSPYGTFDQLGNVFEWNESIIGANRGIRGGSWYLDGPGFLASSGRGVSSPFSTVGIYGFRIASLPSSGTVPEPGAMAVWSMLALSGCGIRRRRIRN